MRISARSSSSSATYFPYTAKLCINGNHWAQRQAAKAGIGFSALDNGFAAVDDVHRRCRRICDSLGPAQIEALLCKWLAILPQPVHRRADQAAGYRYELSILQAEFSLTQMLDAPVSGRIFFEQVIGDNLDIGRPDQRCVDLRPSHRCVAAQRKTPEPFPHPGYHRWCHSQSLHVDYKTQQNQAIPQRRESTAHRNHHQQHRATSRVTKRLTSLPELQAASAFPPTGAYCDVQTTQLRPDHAALKRLATDLTAPDRHRHRHPHRRTAFRPSNAQLTPCCTSLLIAPAASLNGFTNRDLRALSAELRGLPPAALTAGQTTYDLRRLKSHGLITRIPHSHRYTVTEHGLHTAHFLTCVHDRFLPTGLAHLADHTGAPPLQAASRAYNTALENLSHTTLLAA